MSSVREGIFAAKSIHDVERDISQLSKSANEGKYRFYLQSRDAANALLVRLSEISQIDNKENNVKLLADIYRTARGNYTHVLNYHSKKMNGLSEIEISTILNLNRELFNAFHSLVLSFKDLLLNEKERVNMEELMEKGINILSP